MHHCVQNEDLAGGNDGKSIQVDRVDTTLKQQVTSNGTENEKIYSCIQCRPRGESNRGPTVRCSGGQEERHETPKRGSG